MIIRRNSGKSQREMIEKLNALVLAEAAKPVEELDPDFIDECVDYIMEVENSRNLTDKELQTEIGKIYKKLKKRNHTAKRINYKKLLASACVAALIITSTVAVVANDRFIAPSLEKWHDALKDIKPGETAHVSEGFDIQKGDRSVIYDSLKDLIKNTDNEFLYPTKLPNGAKFNKIHCSNYEPNLNGTADYSDDYISIVFSTTMPGSVSFSVRLSPSADKFFLTMDTAKRETINGYDCYYFDDADFCQCHFIYNEAVYTVIAPTIDGVRLIINNLEELTR